MTAIDFAAFVDRLAAVSGETILPFFRSSLGIDDKGPAGHFDPVTAADRAAEQAMRTLIRRSFPEHGIIGEEFGPERADAEYVWVLDPIDGTKSFIAGMPIWGTLIALTRLGEPVFGLMHQPFMRETFSGDGLAARLSRAGRQAKPADAALHRPVGRDPVHHQPAPDERGGSRAPSRRSKRTVKLSRYGGDCYAYCMLAAGHIDLVIETELKPYDILPLIPILAGAGAVVTSWDGGPAALGGRGDRGR